MDRAIDAEARAGRVRRFKLSTGPDDYAVMLAADYAQEARIACRAVCTAHKFLTVQEIAGPLLHAVKSSEPAPSDVPLDRLFQCWC